MPRYALEPSASRKDKRAAQFQSLQEGDQRQQQIDQQSQDGMLQHLAALYGLQQQQQMNPLQMQALQADIQAKGFENQHAPELLASKLGADKAQQNYYGSRNEGAITERDKLLYKQHTGQDWIDPTVAAAQAAKTEADKAAARAREEAMFGAPGTAPAGPSSLGSKAAGLVGAVGQIPAAFQSLEDSMTNNGQDFWAKLFGLTPQVAAATRQPDAQGKRHVQTRAWPWQSPKDTAY